MKKQIELLKSYKAKFAPQEMAYYLGILSNKRPKSTELAKAQLSGNK
jgi:hypothetical protein